MNDILIAIGMETIKPYVSALLLPPLPFLLLILVGARLMYRRRLTAWLLILLGVALTWLGTTTSAAKLTRSWLPQMPPALSAETIQQLQQEAKAGLPTAIVVLGAGRRSVAPEYGLSTLESLSIERLRYGVWLARQTGLPLAFSGGIGHAAKAGITEAETAARIAEQEFRLPLRWGEARSRDTRENGLYTVPMLQEAGIQRIVLVTHDVHQPRALRAFRLGAERSGKPMELIPAPVGLPPPYDWSATDFLPSAKGFEATRMALHEWLGYWLGA